MNAIERSIAALEAPSAHEVEHAQIALERRLASPMKRKDGRAASFLWAGAATAAITLLVLLPALVTKPAAAFADVQRALAEARAVEMTIVTMQGGTPLNRVDVQVDAAGRTRTSIDDNMTIVVDPNAGRMLMLDHANRTGFTVDAPMEKGKETQWLDDLRAFRGQATPIGTRQVDGRTLRGYRLAAHFGSTELWADERDLPVEMTVDAGSSVTMRFDFDFTPELAADAFSTELPPGYARAAAED